MLKRLSLLVALVLAGCSSSSGPFVTRFPIRHVELYREIRLSRQQDTDPELGVRLVSVEPDGTTTIKLLDTGEMCEAKPGGYFSGFGNIGLQLISASAEQSEVVLARRWGETR